MSDATDEVLGEISSERARQIEKWGDCHDDGHRIGQLAAAAAVWACPYYLRQIKAAHVVADWQTYAMPTGFDAPPDEDVGFADRRQQLP